MSENTSSANKEQPIALNGEELGTGHLCPQLMELLSHKDAPATVHEVVAALSKQGKQYRVCASLVEKFGYVPELMEMIVDMSRPEMKYAYEVRHHFTQLAFEMKDYEMVPIAENVTIPWPIIAFIFCRLGGHNYGPVPEPKFKLWEPKDTDDFRTYEKNAREAVVEFIKTQDLPQTGSEMNMAIFNAMYLPSPSSEN